MESMTYRKQRIFVDLAVGREVFLHLLYRNGTFYVAMKKAKLTDFDKTVASGFFYAGSALGTDPGAAEGEAWIWMPVENEGDRNYLFSDKPWEHAPVDAELKKSLASHVSDTFLRFEREVSEQQPE